MPKKIYRTMQGKMIDMESIMTKHETMPAVGNARMNARGDELGPGGRIIRKREDVVALTQTKIETQTVTNGVEDE